MTKTTKFYDGTKLLSMLDINGERPEIYICTTNRSAGKTTYYNRWAVKKFLDKGEKFYILNRFEYELKDAAERFFNSIHMMFFPDHFMDSERRQNGAYYELYLDNNPCGYSIALNKADAIKKCSHLLCDGERMIFDEFQSETDHYCPKEIDKFQSIHQSLARGFGKQSRYLPVYMIANFVTLLNPYYVNMGITDRLQTETRYLKGDGYVLEQDVNESAVQAQKESAFNRAFGKSNYQLYSNEKIYLNDNYAFIDKPKSIGKYIVTLKFHDKHYAIREYRDEGIIYCDDKPDMTFPTKIAITTESHDINYVMLTQNDILISTLRFYFQKGCFRFKNLLCKQCVLTMLSYI